MRKIVYVSGTRADFGLMRRTLQAISAHPALSLSILATGMHFSVAHGETIREIEQSGIPILARVPVQLTPETGATMARTIGAMISTFTDELAAARPDLVLLLGDRGEMLAGAIAALHLGIPVAHIHGGERSGTVDEPVRHAISKLSHLHFAATQDAAARLVRMGEVAANVYVTGAPGLDGMADTVRAGRQSIAAAHGLDPAKPLALLVYHPVLQEAEVAGVHAASIIDAVVEEGCQIVALRPNADAGSAAVRAALEQRAGSPGFALVTHLDREAFLDVMACADVMVGNSSAAIIEAATFGTPVVNVGPRQNLRERNANVADVTTGAGEVAAAVRAALAIGRLPNRNIYGDGATASRIADHLASVVLGPELMMKVNDY